MRVAHASTYKAVQHSKWEHWNSGRCQQFVRWSFSSLTPATKCQAVCGNNTVCSGRLDGSDFGCRCQATVRGVCCMSRDSDWDWLVQIPARRLYATCVVAAEQQCFATAACFERFRAFSATPTICSLNLQQQNCVDDVQTVSSWSNHSRLFEQQHHSGWGQYVLSPSILKEIVRTFPLKFWSPFQSSKFESDHVYPQRCVARSRVARDTVRLLCLN